jgi:hypothetical protein
MGISCLVMVSPKKNVGRDFISPYYTALGHKSRFSGFPGFAVTQGQIWVSVRANTQVRTYLWRRATANIEVCEASEVWILG